MKKNIGYLSIAVLAAAAYAPQSFAASCMFHGVSYPLRTGIGSWYSCSEGTFYQLFCDTDGVMTFYNGNGGESSVGDESDFVKSASSCPSNAPAPADDVESFGASIATVTSATYFKLSRADASTLSDSQKCRLNAGEAFPVSYAVWEKRTNVLKVALASSLLAERGCRIGTAGTIGFLYTGAAYVEENQ